jgi:hypothetical protein
MNENGISAYKKMYLPGFDVLKIVVEYFQYLLWQKEKKILKLQLA